MTNICLIPDHQLISKNKWILGKKFRIPIIQLTDHMWLNKKEGPNVNISIPFGRGNKIIMESRGKGGPQWEKGEGDKRGTG